MAATYRDHYDESENKAADAFEELLEDRNTLYGVLQEYRLPASGSKLEQVTQLAGDHTPAYYAYNQLDTAVDNIDAIYHLMHRHDEEGEVVVLPVSGVHTLIRTALETAAHGYWILQPVNPRMIAKRGVALLMQDNHKQKQNLEEMGRKKDRYERDDRVFRGIYNRLEPQATGDPPRHTSTQVLKAVEHANPWHPTSMTWFGIWQLCSGLAHGQHWPTRSAHHDDIVRHKDSRAPLLVVRRSARFDTAAYCLSAAMNAITVGVNKLVELSGPNEDSPHKHPLPYRFPTDPSTPTSNNWFMKG